MPTRIENILKRARITLADKTNERWEDTDLLAHLDEGHKDLCQQAQILHAQSTITLNTHDPYIDLPEDCWLLTRVLWRGTALPFTTHSALDTQYKSWQDDEGSPISLVYDRRNANEARVYPIPGPGLVGKTEPGVTVDIEGYATETDFGVATEIEGEELSLDQPFGVISAILDQVTAYYIQTPADLVDVNSELATPSMFDTALKYYVVAQAFLTDLNERSQAKGTQQLAFYERELKVAARSAQRDNQRASAGKTTYRRAL